MKIDWKFVILVLLLITQPARAVNVELPLRDLLAGFALCGLMADKFNINESPGLSYMIADKMMAIRNKR